MRPRAFLDLARELVRGPTEAHWRAAVGRAYYALLLEGRAALQRWGFVALRRDQVHAFVRFRFLYAADADLQKFGRTLARLNALRNQADYEPQVPGPFRDRRVAGQAVRDAEIHLPYLDTVEADPLRLAAVIADIRRRWP
jgi:hypothetical protein